MWRAYLIFKRVKRKVILAFREEEELKNAIDGSRWKSFAFEFDQWLRSEYKHRDNEAAYDIREKFHEMLIEENLKLE